MIIWLWSLANPRGVSAHSQTNTENRNQLVPLSRSKRTKTERAKKAYPSGAINAQMKTNSNLSVNNYSR
jgi:hypothetical protein